ncbi:helix-turn-helix transcriptional regulator [Rhodanobacter ginsengisoli]|uniref:Helix-turn-helix transcriptional regulator n=1 Tax=Rhodanobacter ginsengisoli TaxID=418646 RepID=A0ABW0QPU5_9GAMM
MPDFTVRSLLETPSVTVRDVCCSGTCRHKSGEECASKTHLVFPYRGTYLRHVGDSQAVAESNQVLLFNAGQGYQVSHPVAVEGGDASLVLALDEALLRELAPATLTRDKNAFTFRQQQLGIDPRTQALVALLRHSLRENSVERLEAESLSLTLVQRSLDSGTSHKAGANAGRQRLADRAKLILSSDLSRRWTLADIAAEVGVSPVYLTQVFQQVEGVPLYRYQLRLRLARSLDLLSRYEDLSQLALDLGFGSHSHFSASFLKTYGQTPTEFRQAALRR